MIVMLPLALALAAGSAAVTTRVPVLNRTIKRGETVSSTDFSTESRPSAVARDAIGGNAADGMQARRRLASGSVVREGDLMPAQVVQRGEPVVIAYRVGTLTITTQGRALGGGAVGDPIRVVSLATNRTLDGTVERAGRVRLAGQ